MSHSVHFSRSVLATALLVAFCSLAHLPATGQSVHPGAANASQTASATASLTQVAAKSISAGGSSTASAATAASRVERVSLGQASDAVEIEVQTSGPASAPDAQVLTSPNRILLDFPSAVPSAELKILPIHRGALKNVRASLFFRNPPITRLVFDLASPQAYQILSHASGPDRTTYVIRIGSTAATMGPGVITSAQMEPPRRSNSKFVAASASSPGRAAVPAKAAVPANARLQVASIGNTAPVTTPHDQSAATTATTANVVAAETNEQQPPSFQAASPAVTPALVVSYENGALRIHAEQSTMAAILYEVQRQTQADIAIPAGAEQEKVIIDIGPASAREVLSELLNGSPYNFIFIGSEDKLEKVVLTQREPSVQ